MDAFESVVALLLRRQGYWVQQSYKVELTRAEKRAIRRPSTPRWEIDLVAYRPRNNEVLAIECKSFLDSPGVQFRDGAFISATRYKLFSEAKTRRVVLGRLARQLSSSGHCRARPKIKLCLAAGKLWTGTNRADLNAHFRQHGWRLIGPNEIVEDLKKCIDADYENDVAFVVAKLIGREKT